MRLWAEVFHVSASGTGTVKWQQVSEDLVPVNITCIQDSPECVFHITAYNSQVDKILDDMRPYKFEEKEDRNTLLINRMVTFPPIVPSQDSNITLPVSTRIGQASECFVYWKDPMTNDTWGLNFTSPIDAKQFRECCLSVPFIQIFEKSIFVLLAQTGTPKQTETEGETETSVYASFPESFQRTAVHVYDRRAICTPSSPGPTLPRAVLLPCTSVLAVGYEQL
uniref:WH1 domain-containing protein n=1 Tax=Timema shepardi TaxID=629360 RepID=A0A7R9ALP4_TIMSH|nr:unnamed protein product [Timema shepardi]